MQNNRNAILALTTVIGGYLVWANRFAIQHRLESWGVRTPVMRGGVGETVRSLGSKVAGRMEHGAEMMEHQQSRRAGNY